MLETLLLPQFLLLYLWLASAVLVHFRGRVRHKFKRQLTDQSTLLAPYNLLVYLFSGIRRDPILDPEDLPELALLQDNWETIRDEACQLHDGGEIRACERKQDIAFNTFFKRGWKRFYLKWYDDYLPSARSLCPKTIELVERIPSIQAAMFALLPPGSRLGAHRDPFAGSLRYHLGLKTPNSDDCWIEIDGERHSWRDGKALLFDATYIHEAHNRADQTRLILFCDVTRPMSNRTAATVNRFLSKHLVKLTASNNRPDEKLGLVNYVAATIYRIKELAIRFKAWNRPLYGISKVLLILSLVWFPFVRLFF